jgi:ParB-like chromosome segregation protein Spo0J
MEPDLIRQNILAMADDLAHALSMLDAAQRIEMLNAVRVRLSAASPFADQPVDCVLWVPAETVEANDYNPNRVAPPEMKLLRKSIEADGYTMPIVTWLDDVRREVVDGFHRWRIGTDVRVIRLGLRGHLPVTTINQDRTDRADRIAATIRHNRARGKHQVQAMSEIVVDLSRRNHSDAWIARELGMDADEVLRLKQISGLAEMFADREFSEAWE